jgi:hypothetical protein
VHPEEKKAKDALLMSLVSGATLSESSLNNASANFYGCIFSLKSHIGVRRRQSAPIVYEIANIECQRFQTSVPLGEDA